MNAQRFYMARMEVSPAALMRFASTQGLARADDDGYGYSLHAWLAAMFGPLAPKPFRLMSGVSGGRRTLLAYSHDDGAALYEHAQCFADPAAFAALATDAVLTKPMPGVWRTGQKVGFEALTCPMTRKEDQEKDVYLRALDRLGDSAPSREQVFRDWFARQVSGAADPVDLRIEAFGRARMIRKSHTPGGGRRLVEMERPHAVFSGTLTVRNPEAFSCLLERGVGRHRAFGFGMLLLRPSR